MAFLILFFFLLALPAYGAPPKPPTPPQSGPVCNGIVDDTAALRALIASADTVPFGTIQLPGSKCRFTDTLVFGGRTDRYSSISMRGHSEYTTALVYDGPSDRPAILISHMSAFVWERLTVERANLTKAGVGVLIDGPFNSGGTMNTGITFDHLNVTGFGTGMQAGGGDAASEIECRNCVFRYNAIGWTASGYNSLNFRFYNLGIAHNDIGIKVGGPWVTDAPHIIGGDSAGNTIADIECGNGFGVLSIDNFRAEVAAGGMFLRGGSCGHSVALANNVIIASCWCPTPVIELENLASATVRNSVIYGQIKMGQNPLVARIHDNVVFEGSSGLPIVMWTGGWYQKLYLTGNTKPDMWGGYPGHPHWFVDYHGVIASWDGSALVIHP